MKLLTLPIILLVLLPRGTSAGIIPRCRCEGHSQGVNVALVLTVVKHPPSPHCSNTEVIAHLRGGAKRCLDPESPFTKNLLHAIRQHAARRTACKKSTKTGVSPE